jgi:3-mercaptopyruvate sulfurtransferase SseA
MPKRKPKKQKFPMLILIAGGLLLLVSTAWLLFQSTSSPAPTVTAVQGGQTYSEVERVSIADARAALDAGTAVFLDVRIADAYTIQHITSALNIPEAEIGTRLAELDPNQWIITYCT